MSNNFNFYLIHNVTLTYFIYAKVMFPPDDGLQEGTYREVVVGTCVLLSNIQCCPASSFAILAYDPIDMCRTRTS